MHFFDFPDKIPDSRTIWLFRERLSSTGKDKAMWNAIWDQFEKKGIRIKSVTIQDATYIETDPGKHGRKKPPVNVDTAYPPLNTDIKVEDTYVNPGEKKKLTREEMKQKKIAAMEKKRQRINEKKILEDKEVKGWNMDQKRIKIILL